MYTIEYKTLYINGYCNKPNCRVVFYNGSTLGEYKSLRAAKLAITKFLKLAGAKPHD